MLQYYESHLVFTNNDLMNGDEDGNNLMIRTRIDGNESGI